MNIMAMLQNIMMNNTNPILANAIQMAQSGDREGLEKMARNICKERNIDYDKEFPKFMQNFSMNNKKG